VITVANTATSVTAGAERVGDAVHVLHTGTTALVVRTTSLSSLAIAADRRRQRTRDPLTGLEIEDA
jgi:hypothetical protein